MLTHAKMLIFSLKKDLFMLSMHFVPNISYFEFVSGGGGPRPYRLRIKIRKKTCLHAANILSLSSSTKIDKENSWKVLGCLRKD